jgi:hypothetical protein
MTMERTLLSARKAAVFAVGFTLAASPALPAIAQSPPPTPGLVRGMLGTWSVEQWMWPSPNAPAMHLPAAVAERRTIAGSFIQETMSTPPGAKDAFSRISYFGYNAVNRQYEYFSIDTRAPQMMNERSAEGDDASAASRGVNLIGGTFVAPQWGDARDAAFRYRLVVGPIQGDHQEVDMYLTPLSAAAQPEFLAFKYVYTHER